MARIEKEKLSEVTVLGLDLAVEIVFGEAKVSVVLGNVNFVY